MFYKSVDKHNNKEMFNFLHDHYEYDTMNSWNGLKSIANNVKLYNLHLRNDWTDALKALEEDEYFRVNEMLKDFEEVNGVRVEFNGSSGGHLVMYSRYNNGHILGDDFNPCSYYSYEDFKLDVQDTYGSLKNFSHTLKERVELVQAFDKLCDELVKLVDIITDEYLERQSRLHDITVTRRFTEYHYKDEATQKLHEKYMKEHGYGINESSQYDDETFYTIYESFDEETITVEEDK